MLILTDNQYLKLGFQKAIHQELQEQSEGLVLYDAGDVTLFFWSKKDSKINLFEILTKGISIGRRNNIKSISFFLRYLKESRELGFQHSRKKSNQLSQCEETVIEKLCEGYSYFEISKASNRSIKTISSQKIRALRKLRMRNIQLLHLTMVRWNSLTGQDPPGNFTCM